MHKCEHGKKSKKAKSSKGGAGNPLDPKDMTIGSKFWSD
tara:strand:- start:403 stop:519 length:117 start_codon:yes stop_codon:yes gene_type:complete